MKRCIGCAIPNTRPDTAFIGNVCSACVNYGKRVDVDWAERKRELISLLDRHNGSCLVPSSAGKDSHAQALFLKSLGADVTAVTARTCYLTPLGRANIENLARHVKTVEVVPNLTVRAKLNRLGMELVGDASWPQHASIWAIPFRAAVDLNIPLMFFGENSQDAYGGPIGSETAKQMTRRWTSEFGGMGGLRAADFVGMEGITERDMRDYALPSDTDIGRIGVEAHFLGAYQPWSSRGNAEVAIAHGMQTMLPCEANWWDFENLDCLMTQIHDAQMYRKYGYGRGAAQISVDIRDGIVSRDEAMEWIRKHDGLLTDKYLGLEIGALLDHLGMTRKRLIELLDQFTNWELFSHVENDRPILKDAG